MVSRYPVSDTVSGTLIPNEAATSVASRQRRDVSDFPRCGCTALVTKISNEFVRGSIHMDVPVKPVWAYEPIGYSSPRLLENGESISQPSARRIGCSAGLAGSVNF